MSSNQGEVVLSLPCKRGGVVQFSDAVVICPLILRTFDRPFWMRNPSSSFQSSPHTYNDWVEENEVLTVFNLEVGGWFVQKHIEIPVRSPVTGILLNPNVGFQLGSNDGFFTDNVALNAKVLLPAGVTPPTDAQSMFREFCDITAAYRNQIFLKPKTLEYTAEEVDAAIQKQRNAPVKIMSLRNDFPDTLEELKVQKVNVP